jgi:hypothetical protein
LAHEVFVARGRRGLRRVVLQAQRRGDLRGQEAAGVIGCQHRQHRMLAGILDNDRQGQLWLAERRR